MTPARTQEQADRPSGSDQGARQMTRLRRDNERLRQALADQAKQLAEQATQVVDATQQIADLERKLALRQQNSTTSSKPPASDGLAGRQRVRGRR